MFSTVTVPLDGSALAARALPFALRLARSSNGRLVLVRAHLPLDGTVPLMLEYSDQSSDDLAQLEREARAEFQAIVERLATQNVAVVAHFVDGAAADVILDTAASEQADVIMMSTHGRSGVGRWLYGSVADQVLHRASVPVMLVSPGCQASWAGNGPVRVMVALDGSDQSAEALGPATELATALQAEIILLNVVEPPETIYSEVAVQAERIQTAERAQAVAYLEKIAEQLRPSTPWPVAVRVACGPVAASIASTARDVHADAIAMATHGRGGLARLVLGRVTTGVLQQSTMPLLVCPPATATKHIVESGVAIAVAI